MDWEAALWVFLGTALADMIWAAYFVCVSRKHKALAAISSGLIILIGSTITLDYVKDPRLRYFAVVGAVVGTWITLILNEWWDKHNASKRSEPNEADG
jgi:hypothetical protein